MTSYHLNCPPLHVKFCQKQGGGTKCPPKKIFTIEKCLREKYNRIFFQHHFTINNQAYKWACSTFIIQTPNLGFDFSKRIWIKYLVLRANLLCKLLFIVKISQWQGKKLHFFSYGSPLWKKTFSRLRRKIRGGQIVGGGQLRWYQLMFSRSPMKNLNFF